MAADFQEALGFWVEPVEEPACSSSQVVSGMEDLADGVVAGLESGP